MSLLKTCVRLAIYNPIYIAARKGNVKIFEAILRRHDCDFSAMEIVYESSLRGKTGVLACFERYLKEHGQVFPVNFDEIDEGDGVSKNPLYFAVKGNYTKCAMFLMKRDADPKIKNSIHYACLHKNQTIGVELVRGMADIREHNILRICCEKGLDKVVREMISFLTAREVNYYSVNTKKYKKKLDPPLYLAAKNGHYGVFKQLLTHQNIDPNLPSLKKGALRSRPIHVLARANRNSLVKMMERLIIKSPSHTGNRIELNVRNLEGNTALHIAMLSPYKRSIIIVKMLLVCGADYKILNNERKSPLYYAFNDAKRVQFEKWVEMIEKIEESEEFKKRQKNEREGSFLIGEYDPIKFNLDEQIAEIPNEEARPEEVEDPKEGSIELEEQNEEKKLDENGIEINDQENPINPIELDSTVNREKIKEEEDVVGENLDFIKREKADNEITFDCSTVGFDDDIEVDLSDHSMSTKNWKYLRKRISNWTKSAKEPEKQSKRTKKKQEKAILKLRRAFSRVRNKTNSQIHKDIRFIEVEGEIDYTTNARMKKKVPIKLNFERPDSVRNLIIRKLKEKAFGKKKLKDRFLAVAPKKKENENETDSSSSSGEETASDCESESESISGEEEEVEIVGNDSELPARYKMNIQRELSESESESGSSESSEDEDEGESEENVENDEDTIDEDTALDIEFDNPVEEKEEPSSEHKREDENKEV